MVTHYLVHCSTIIMPPPKSAAKIIREAKKAEKEQVKKAQAEAEKAKVEREKEEAEAREGLGRLRIDDSEPPPSTPGEQYTLKGLV